VESYITNIGLATMMIMSSNTNNMSIESVPVSSLMTNNVKLATENQTIRVVCRMMYEYNIGSIVIFLKDSTFGNAEGERPIGIVTERDIVRLIGHSDPLLIDAPVREVMSSPLITINPNSSIRDAMESMQQKDIRRLPVVDNKGKMVGIITDKDIFRIIVKNQSLVSSFLSDPILVDQQSIYGKFTDYWFRDILHAS
jgi:CBS domain-containing protein